MDLIDKMKEISTRIAQQSDHIQTEEATKAALVMPFIAALGYDVFNPMEVIPEFTADTGIKKGEKVDYAIRKDGQIIMLIECKWSGNNLQQEHASQLHRYFSVTESRFGVLTNGIQYTFYSDIDDPNKMDAKPFFEFNLLNFEEHQIRELKKFTKSTFSLENILATASKLKYANMIKKILEEELNDPSERFVRFFASQVYEGRLTQSILSQFTEIVKEARKQFITSKINQRLKSALKASETMVSSDKQGDDIQENDAANVTEKGIETTVEEIESFNIVKAILRQNINISRITIRDTKKYCSVLLDNNNRKPICRLYFNQRKKYIGLFSQKTESKIIINKLDDIFQYADQIQTTVNDHDTKAQTDSGIKS